ncbi:MAG: flagellar basal body-associated FliL family protein [Alicyclobacillus sp.]|nr:flagellar basal body-associated FliL family protein [Alicyclobacillus sp.]
MKRAWIWVVSVICGVAVLMLVGAGGYWYFLHRNSPHRHVALSPAQARALQIDLPQMTSNLQDGLIQYAVTLQASDVKTKSQIIQIQPEVEDALIRTMHEFTSKQLKGTAGYDALKLKIEAAVDQLLTGGKVTKVYFSSQIVQ